MFLAPLCLCIPASFQSAPRPAEPPSLFVEDMEPPSSRAPGAGPTNTPYGPASLSPPIHSFLPVASTAGAASTSGAVPASASGLPIWFQGLDLLSGQLSNSLALTIQ